LVNSKVFSVGFADCDAMALIGHRRVLSTARPRNRNFPHTCWMNFFDLESTVGDFTACFSYCTFDPYMIGVHGCGECCSFLLHVGIVLVPFLRSLALIGRFVVV
jgi:hypothetical protein